MRNLASRLQARLEAALASGNSAGATAAVAVSIWVEIAAVFSPIIGNGGFAALYRRAVAVTVSSVPALCIALEDTPEKNTFAGLHQALSEQPCAEIAKVNGALLQNFFDLLATLIGGPLTERLLTHLPDTAASADPPEGIKK